MPLATTTDTPTWLFRELLRKAFDRQRVDPTEDAEFYLVSLLERFVRIDPGFFSRPLALDFLEAFHADAVERFAKLKKVGDTTLFLSGVFMESLERQPVGVDYYARLGGSAYRRLARQPAGSPGHRSGAVFRELADRFLDFVRVLSELSDSEMFGSDRDTLRIYRRWLATRGTRDAESLIRRGVIPFAPTPDLPH